MGLFLRKSDKYRNPLCLFIFSLLFIFTQRKINTLGADGKSLNVCPVISRATLDTVLRCALSYVDTGIQSTDRYENNIHIKELFLNTLFAYKS